MSQVQIRQKFQATPERVFAALSDHAKMGQWLSAPISVPVPTPTGGVGTVRRIHLGPMHIDEEVIEHEPPRHIVYTIVNRVFGVRAHRGEITVEPTAEGGCEVRWVIRIESGLPGFATLVTGSLKPAIALGLSKLSKKLS